jgi:hypothetical protein
VSGLQIPRIQISQTSAMLGIDADLGEQSIQQPKADVEIKTVQPKLQINSEQGKLFVDSSRAWDALGRGPALETMSRIYSQAKDIALQGIAKIVQDGNRMAAIHTGENAIAELARESTNDIKFDEFMYMGEASVDNVDVRFEPGKLDIQVESGRVELNVQPNRPIVDYHRGKLDIYMQQYPKVEITPPQIDYRL